MKQTNWHVICTALSQSVRWNGAGRETIRLKCSHYAAVPAGLSRTLAEIINDDISGDDFPPPLLAAKVLESSAVADYDDDLFQEAVQKHSQPRSFAARPTTPVQTLMLCLINELKNERLRAWWRSFFVALSRTRWLRVPVQDFVVIKPEDNLIEVYIQSKSWNLKILNSMSNLN